MIDNRLFEKYDGLIFDMDGTLIDTMPVHARAWSMVGEQFGYRFRWCNREHYRLSYYARCWYATRTFK